MPPPNITGKLHMGHALFLTIQDALTRYWKNSGHSCLWLPGLDHAGLATYDKIQKHQKEAQLDYETASQEIEIKHREIILSQIKQLGALPDWEHLTYTLDKNYEDFTLKTLRILHEDERITFEDGQFYLNMQDLATELKNDLLAGTFKIFPEYEIKNLLPFLDNFELWNISRQIPWGTKIPLAIEDGKIKFQIGASEDSLDTWFNSSLWSLATLQKDKQLMEQYYPATLIETGADILFFWCARMLIMGHYAFKNQERLGLSLKSKYPFYSIYLHGIIRDKFGRKYSKTEGNGIDPLDMIAKYGADATRLFLITRSGPSEDITFNENDMPSYRKFMNKIWQSARFFSMYAHKAEMRTIDKNPDFKLPEELIRYQQQFCGHMDNYRLLEASRLIHSIFKEWFCDQWIESHKSKIQRLDRETITNGLLILEQLLAMIEPFCPFIASEINKELFNL